MRIILDRPDIKVCEVHTQSEIKNLRGHSVRLDIRAESADGEPIDIEIQRENKGAGVKRARYYKESAEGVKSMCGVMEELIEQEKREMIVKMKKTGKLSNEDIAEVTGFTVEEVEAIDEKSLATAY